MGRQSFGIDAELAEEQHRPLYRQGGPGQLQLQSNVLTMEQQTASPLASPRLPHASAASPSSSSGFFKFANRKKKSSNQSSMPLSPSSPFSPSDQVATSPLPPTTHSNREAILDSSHAATRSISKRRTSSMFHRPRTADVDRRTPSNQLAGRFPVQNGPSQTSSNEPQHQTTSSRTAPLEPAPATDTIRPLRRLLGARSVSSNALKEQFRRHDLSSSPVPAIPSMPIDTPRSPRGSSGKLRDFGLASIPTHDGLKSSKSSNSVSPAQSTFSRLMGLSRRPSNASPLASASQRAATASTFGLVPVGSHSQPYPSQSSLSTAQDYDTSFPSSHSANLSGDISLPSSSSRYLNSSFVSGPSPSTSSSAWHEASGLETLHDVPTAFSAVPASSPLPPPHRRRVSAARLSTTEFPSILTEGATPSPISPMDAATPNTPGMGGTDSDARSVHQVRERRFPPRASDGQHRRQRLGSSASIGVGLGINSPAIGSTNYRGGEASGETSLAGTPRTSFSHSMGMSQNLSESVAGLQPPPLSASSRHASDAALSNASRNLAMSSQQLGGQGSNGGTPAASGASSTASLVKGFMLRKASFGSSASGPTGTSKINAAGGAAALFGGGPSSFAGGGNASGGGSSVLGHTRQRTSSLFASLTSPFSLGSGNSGSKDTPPLSSQNSPVSRHPPSAARTGSQPLVGFGSKPDGPAPAPEPVINRNRAHSAVALEGKSHASRQEKAPLAHIRIPSTSLASSGQPTPVDAAAAAVDAIRAKDTEAQDDIRQRLLGDGPPVTRSMSRRRLKHSVSEEKLGSMRMRRSPSLQSDAAVFNKERLDAARNAELVPYISQQDLQSAQHVGPSSGSRGAISKSTSSASLSGASGVPAAAVGDTSETSMTSLAHGTDGGAPGFGLASSSQIDVGSTTDIEAWAEVEGPKLLALLSKTMSRADMVRSLASTSTLTYPFRVSTTNSSSSSVDILPAAAPLEPHLATAVRRAALKLFMRRFMFKSEALDIALRKLLMEIKLPSETQQIDRIMEAFAQRYMECNEGIYASEDQPYILAFSLMMLHTDAFNKNAKNKMTKADYIKNTSAGGVPADILEYFYDNTTFTQFIHVDEETDMAVAALPTGAPPTATSNNPSQMNSRSASSASLSGLGQSTAGLSMSSADANDSLVNSIAAGGNPATSTFGAYVAGVNSSSSALPMPMPATSNSVMLNGPGGKMKVDPYTLIKQNQLFELRPSFEHVIPRETPYLYAGTEKSLDVGRLRRTFIHAPVLEIIQQRKPQASSFQPVRANAETIVGVPSVTDHFEAVARIKVPKAGIVLRKDDIPLAPPIGTAGGDLAKAAKKAVGKKWKKWGLVLSASQALFFKDFVWTSALESQLEEQAGEWWGDPDLLPRSVSDIDDDGRSSSMSNGTSPADAILRKRSITISPRVSYFKPDMVVPLTDAIAVRDETYVAKGEWTFRLWFRQQAATSTPSGSQTDLDAQGLESRHILLQASTEQEMNDWIGLLNYSATYRSVGDRRVDVAELSRILCETGPSQPPTSGPDRTSFDKVNTPGGLRRSNSLARYQGAMGSIQVISSTTSNMVRTTSRRNSIAAEQPAGYLVSPLSTMQGFVTKAAADHEEYTKLLEEEARVARHLAILTPFLRATREKIEGAAIPLGDRLRERRLQHAKYSCRLEILTQDLQRVSDAAPPTMVFIPTPKGVSGPIFEETQMPRVSLNEAREIERSASIDSIVEEFKLSRVDSSPPQLGMDVLPGGFETRFSIFGSDRSGPRSSGSQSSFPFLERPSQEAQASSHLGRPGQMQRVASEMMEELTQDGPATSPASGRDNYGNIGGISSSSTSTALALPSQTSSSSSSSKYGSEPFN
ncbi:hypothetical protein OC861_002764 [Tilletia horrida]|nr:hypothetical protein OC861_002764 [Tilletia horrida]